MKEVESKMLPIFHLYFFCLMCWQKSQGFKKFQVQKKKKFSGPDIKWMLIGRDVTAVNA
jgi:hypothetical protein